MNLAEPQTRRIGILIVLTTLFACGGCQTTKRWTSDDDYIWYRSLFPLTTSPPSPRQYYTEPPKGPYPKDFSYSINPILIAVFVTVIIVSILYFVCKYFMCMWNYSTNAAEINATIHALRQASIVLPTAPIQEAEEMHRARWMGNGSRNASAPVADRPPHYTQVILDDLTQREKFPKVESKLNVEAPPPQYDEKIFH